MKKVLTILLAVMLLAVGVASAETLKLASHNAVIEGNAYRVRYEQDIQDAAAAASEYGYDITYASFVSNWDAATETRDTTSFSSTRLPPRVWTRSSRRRRTRALFTSTATVSTSPRMLRSSTSAPTSTIWATRPRPTRAKFWAKARRLS